MEQNSLASRLKQEMTKARQKLAEMRSGSRVILDASPFPSVVFDNKLQIIDCNAASFESLGYGSREEFIANWPSILEACFPEPRFPNAKPETLLERMQYAARHGVDSFEMTLRVGDGHSIRLAITLRRVEHGPSFNLLLYHSDLANTRDAKRELFTHDMLIECVNQIASLLTNWGAGGFELAMNMSLALLGGAMNADRAIVWTYRSNDGADELHEAYTWLADGMTRSEISAPARLTMPSWLDALRVGAMIDQVIVTAPAPEKAQMDARGTKSVLVVPVLTGGDFWGVLTFEHCRGVRMFSESEQDILGSAGLLIASAILRNDMTKELMKAKKAALQSAEAKNRFLANMSHEIRTPMNAILGMTAIARTANGDVAKIEDCLVKIEQASKHMMGMINDILDMSKLDSHTFKLQIAPFSFREMLRGIVDMSSIRCGEKDLHLSAHIAPEIHDQLIGDAQRIGQVINNLLSNAIKFSPAGETVRIIVSLVSESESESRIKIEVIDHGIGIPSDRLPTLFEAFEQADARLSRRYDGTGLGLAIAKNLVELMKGEIGCDSEQGRGSTFWVDLTLPHGIEFQWDEDGDFEASADDETYIEYDFSGKTIMVVDDIDINREIIETLLEETGAAIVHARDGIECLEKFIAEPELFDLIFMDVHMPEMDGMEATRRIRASGVARAEDVPIIALTANAFAEDVDACLSAGMNGHISKPIDPGSMMDKACRAIGGTMKRVSAAH